MEVHNVLGNGFQEVIYQRALWKELAETSLIIEREKELEIFYKDLKIGKRRVDFLVEGRIIVEIKAITYLDNVHLAQALNYLEAFGLQVGLLINFGGRSLQFKRLLNPSNRKKKKSLN